MPSRIFLIFTLPGPDALVSANLRDFSVPPPLHGSDGPNSGVLEPGTCRLDAGEPRRVSFGIGGGLRRAETASDVGRRSKKGRDRRPSGGDSEGTAVSKSIVRSGEGRSSPPRLRAWQACTGWRETPTHSHPGRPPSDADFVIRRSGGDPDPDQEVDFAMSSLNPWCRAAFRLTPDGPLRRRRSRDAHKAWDPTPTRGRPGPRTPLGSSKFWTWRNLRRLSRCTNQSISRLFVIL